jgi:beta-1,2-mannosidase
VVSSAEVAAGRPSPTGRGGGLVVAGCRVMSLRRAAHFPLGPFRPYEGNPVLVPRGSGWESGSVYNAAAVVREDRVVLLYRAHAPDVVSHVGLAVSEDGLHFEREPEPVLSPAEPYDRYGVEDPRVTEIDGTYYLTYTGWDRERALLCLATSTDLRNWTRHGPMLPGVDTRHAASRDRTGPYSAPGPWSKAGGILPVPVGGRYLMYYGEGSVYLAYSTDLLHWTPAEPQSPVLEPVAGTFAANLVEVGPPPLLTANGLILLVYNAAARGTDDRLRYTCGQALIDPLRPGEALATLRRPWLEPRTARERHGLFPNVTFVEGLVHFRGTWFAYYGQADSTTGVATARDTDTYATSR